jgi:Holliday junction DNA helicase RuvB
MVYHDPLPNEEREFDRALRPTSFAEFVGQEQVVENLRIAITAARSRQEPLDHVLFSGPPGLGKTTLSHLIAQGMGANLIATSGPALTGPKDLAGTLVKLERGDVLFIDEVHRLPRAIEEYLYTAMEDHAIDVVLDPGPAGRSLRLGLKPFTLVAATTREGLLSAPFRNRFGLVERLEPYPPEQLERIVARAGPLLAVAIAPAAGRRIAERARGVPRVALRITRRARDQAQVEGAERVDLGVTDRCLKRLGIDQLGLEDLDRRILRALAQRGEPTGLKTLAAMVDESEDTLEEVFEPHLLRCGLLVRTPRGRMTTARAHEHLGLPPPRVPAHDATGELFPDLS